MTTVKETKKAILLEKDDTKFWIQKRWLRADGSLTPSGQKSFEQAKVNAEFDAEEKAKGKRYYKISHLIERETEKALMIKVNVDLYNLERDIIWSIWIPKSLTVNGHVAGGFLQRKIEEAQQEVYLRYKTGGKIDTNFDDFIYVKNS